MSENGSKQHVPDSPLDEMEIAEGISYYLVRLVFRPFSQEKRTIGTSVAQRQNASDFAHLKHSSPSSGDTDTCVLTQRTSPDHDDRQTERRTETDIRTNRRT